jgi:hypothetical protein
MLNILHIRKIVSNSDNVFLTAHSIERITERGLKYEDIISAINSGEIIEQYPEDFPNPSCLILGINCKNEYIHIVCGTDDEYLWIITAYYPDEDKWENDYKTRKV